MHGYMLKPGASVWLEEFSTGSTRSFVDHVLSNNNNQIIYLYQLTFINTANEFVTLQSRNTFKFIKIIRTIYAL